MVDHDASPYQKDHPGRWWRPEIDKYRYKKRAGWKREWDGMEWEPIGSGRRTKERQNEEGFEGGRVGLGLQLYIPVCM